MPAGSPDPEAVLRGHRGEVQALDFDAAERFLVSGDSLGEVRVWALGDLRPCAIRRLHPLSGGILSLRMFRCGRRQMLGTQGRDGATHLWACSGGGDEGLLLSEEPVRSFVRDCYSFCRFGVLAAEQPAAADGDEPPPGEQQQLVQHGQQEAEAFVAAALAGNEPASGSCCPGEARAAAAAGHGRPACSQRDGAADGGSAAAAIWALHACPRASREDPPALLAIPGGDERTAEVACAACGARVAEFREEAAGRKLGMLMAVQLYCPPPPPAAAQAAAAAAAAEVREQGGGTAAAAGAAVEAAPAAAAPAAGPKPATGPAGGLAAALAAPAAAPASEAEAGVSAAAAVPAGAALQAPRIHLAAGYEDGSLVVWDLAAPRGAPPLAQRQLCSEPITALAVDSGGAGGACGSAEAAVVAFRLGHAAGKVSARYEIELRQQGIGDVAVRPDRRLLATAGWDGRVRLYSYKSGRQLAILKYHTSPLTALRFAPRSMLLATAARDGTLALWSVYQS